MNRWLRITDLFLHVSESSGESGADLNLVRGSRLKRFKDVFREAGTENGFGYTHDSIHPSKRIDYIFAAGELAKRILNCEALFQGNFRMNINDPKGFALSDHLPVLADFG